MKITSNPTHAATEIEFEAPLNEEYCRRSRRAASRLPGRVDIAERTEDHADAVAGEAAGFSRHGKPLSAVTYDVIASRMPTTRRLPNSSGSWRAT